MKAAISRKLRRVWLLLVLGMLAVLADRAQEPVQVIDDQHLLQLVTTANADYRSSLRNVACREEITFIPFDIHGNPKHQTQYEFDYSFPVDQRRQVAVIEQRVPLGKTKKLKDFDARESVGELNWRDLFRMFESPYHENYAYGSLGEKEIDGHRVYVFEFRPVSGIVAGFDASFEPFLDGYRVHAPLAGRAFVDAQTFRIRALELQALGLPASRRFPLAKRIDFMQYSVTVDFASVSLGGKLRYLPKLIRSDLLTSQGRIVEERRYSDFHLLGPQ